MPQQFRVEVVWYFSVFFFMRCSTLICFMTGQRRELFGWSFFSNSMSGQLTSLFYVQFLKLRVTIRFLQYFVSWNLAMFLSAQLQLFSNSSWPHWRHQRTDWSWTQYIHRSLPVKNSFYNLTVFISSLNGRTLLVNPPMCHHIAI